MAKSMTKTSVFEADDRLAAIKERGQHVQQITTLNHHNYCW